MVTLATSIDADQTEFAVEGDLSGVNVGMRFALDDELLDLSGYAPYELEPGGTRRPGVDPRRWRVVRGAGGSWAATHTQGTQPKAAATASIVSDDLTPPSPIVAASGVLVQAVAIDVTAAEIAEGVAKEAIPALAAGKGPILVTANVAYLAGAVGFGSNQDPRLEDGDEAVIAEGTASVFAGTDSRLIGLQIDPGVDLAGRVNAPVNLVIPAAGWVGAIESSEIVDGGQFWAPGDTFVVDDGSGDAEGEVDTVANSYAITAVIQGANNRFRIAGDHTADFAPGDGVRVYGSTGNDDSHTVAAVTLNGGDTEIEITGTIVDGTADGHIGNEETGDIGAIASYTLTAPGTAYPQADELGLGATSGSGGGAQINVLSTSHDSDGTGRLLVTYFEAALA